MTQTYCHILVPNDELDLITRKTLEAVNASPDVRITIAGPGEGERGGVEAPPIRSKMDLKAIFFYRRLIKQLGVTGTFSVSTSALATMIAATAWRRDVINIGYRGTQARIHRTDPANHLALLNRRVRHVVCETSDIEEYLGGLIGPSKVSGMPKPFMLEWADDAMKNPKRHDKQDDSTLKLIYIGMAKGRPQKGLRQLIEAMKLLEGESVTLTVIGSADESDMEIAPSLVTFLGPRTDAINFIPTHDVLMLTSIRDASPRTVREAQACGVPCIVTDIPGARDLIADGETGLLIKPDSPEAIAESVRRLLRHPEERKAMASKTRDFIARNFSFEKYVDYFIRLFKSLCSKPD